MRENVEKKLAKHFFWVKESTLESYIYLTKHSYFLKSSLYLTPPLKLRLKTLKLKTLKLKTLKLKTLKKAYLATVMLPALTLAAILPTTLAQSAPSGEGNEPFVNRMLSFGKKKDLDRTKNIDDDAAMPVDSEPVTIMDLQQEIRHLNGQIEELSHTIELMQEEIQKIKNINGLPNANVQSDKSESSKLVTRQKSHKSKNQAGQAAIGSDDTINEILMDDTQNDLSLTKNDKLGALQDKIKQEKTNDEASPQRANSHEEKNTIAFGGNDVTLVPETENAKELYDMGYRYILSGDYRAAESVFLAFQLRYPDDTLIGDASFWLGEALFGQKRYREAAQIYIDVQRNYNDSPRGAENLLKLGMSMSQLDEQKVACETFAEVTKRYKNVDPAVLKRIKDEQSRNKCS